MKHLTPRLIAYEIARLRGTRPRTEECHPYGYAASFTNGERVVIEPIDYAGTDLAAACRRVMDRNGLKTPSDPGVRSGRELLTT